MYLHCSLPHFIQGNGAFHLVMCHYNSWGNTQGDIQEVVETKGRPDEGWSL